MSWVSEAAKTIKALSKPSFGEILKPFPAINPASVPAGSVLLFYGTPGNKLTERLGTNLYGFPFNPPPFHAALMMRDGIFHNVGKFRSDKLLSAELRSTRRIDAATFKPMTPEMLSDLMARTELDTSVPHTGLDITDYGIWDFLHFGFKFIGHGKEPVCSGDVVRLLKPVGVTCSNYDDMHTAPWDLLSWAIQHRAEWDLKTVFIGKDFKPSTTGA